jgi:beta-galactosidase
VARDFTKKESYYVFQSWWTSKPMVHIYGHSWPVRWGGKNEEKMVKVYSNAEEVELFLNGKSYGVRKVNRKDFPASGLRWMLKFKEGKNTVHVIATKGKVKVEDEIVFDYQTSKWENPSKVVLEKVKDENEIVTLQVTLVDKNNTLCLDASNVVAFDLIGDGALIENQGTSDGSRKVQAHNGRVVIKIKKKGKSIVSASVNGLASSFIEL